MRIDWRYFAALAVAMAVFIPLSSVVGMLLPDNAAGDICRVVVGLALGTCAADIAGDIAKRNGWL
jgi:hypothetical protein